MHCIVRAFFFSFSFFSVVCCVCVCLCVFNVFVCVRCDVVCHAAECKAVCVSCVCLCALFVYVCGVSEVSCDVVWYVFGCVLCCVCVCFDMCGLFLMHCVMSVWYVLCVFVFVRVVVKRACVLFAHACVLLLGLRAVCELVFVCLAVIVRCL